MIDLFPRLRLADDLVARALGELKARPASAVLVAHLAQPDTDSSRHDIILALQKIDDPSSLAALVTDFEQHYYDRDLIRAIAAIGKCSAVAPLSARLLKPSEHDWDVELSIANALLNLQASGCDLQGVTATLTQMRGATETASYALKMLEILGKADAP